MIRQMLTIGQPTLMANTFTAAARMITCVICLLLLKDLLAHTHSKERDEDAEPWDGKFVEAHGKHEFRVGDVIIGDSEEWFGGRRGTVVELYHNKLNGKPMIKVRMADIELGTTTGYEKDWKIVLASPDAAAQQDLNACAAHGSCAVEHEDDVQEQQKFERRGTKVGGRDYEFRIGERIIGIHKGWFIEGKIGKVFSKWIFEGERHIMVEYEDGTGFTTTVEKEWAQYEDSEAETDNESIEHNMDNDNKHDSDEDDDDDDDDDEEEKEEDDHEEHKQHDHEDDEDDEDEEQERDDKDEEENEDGEVRGDRTEHVGKENEGDVEEHEDL